MFLVANRVLSDLEFPESKFMQRKLRLAKREDIAYVTFSAGGKLKKALHKNRLSAKDAYWADEAAPEEKSESIDLYLDKVDKLSAIKYSSDFAPIVEGEPVVEISWYGEGDKLLEQLSLSKDKVGKRVRWIARSTSTHVPVEVTRSTAEQLGRDLSVIFGD